MRDLAMIEGGTVDVVDKRGLVDYLETTVADCCAINQTMCAVPKRREREGICAAELSDIDLHHGLFQPRLCKLILRII